MFNPRFIKDISERAISTFVQALGAAMAIPGPSFIDSLKVAGVAAIICVGKAVAASKVGDPETASIGKG